MARKRPPQEEEKLERWLVSYADFMTLLFAFFVVMYAISSVNEGKYRVLSDTMVRIFSQTPASSVSTPAVVEPSEPVPTPPSESVIVVENAGGGSEVIMVDRPEEADPQMEVIAENFTDAMRTMIDRKLINVTQGDNWVEIEINTSLLFASGSAELEEGAIPILRRLAQIVSRYPNPIQVEGFTDNQPINNYLYPSNWELSAARAASVVHLFMKSGVQPERMSAIGFGEYRPVADNASEAGRRANRRVVLVILSDAEQRRTLEAKRHAAGQVAVPTPAVSGEVP
jgi:chemotaxis protein MotB